MQCVWLELFLKKRLFLETGFWPVCIKSPYILLGGMYKHCAVTYLISLKHAPEIAFFWLVLFSFTRGSELMKSFVTDTVFDVSAIVAHVLLWVANLNPS